MMSEIIAPVIRRAVLDFLADVGGEHNDHVLSLQLAGLGHRVARRDVRDMFTWLADRGLVTVDQLGPYLAATITPDGIDVAGSVLRIEGISRHKTGV